MMLSTRLRMVAVASEKKPPQIVGTGTAAGNVLTLDVPIPLGDEGDLLLLITQRTATLFAEPTGWHEDVSLGPSPVGHALQAFLREADGTEGGVVSVVRSDTSSLNRQSAGIVYRFRGWSVPGSPNGWQSTTNSPLPTVEATAPSVVICAVAREPGFPTLQTMPAGYATDMVEPSSQTRFVAISNPNVPKGLISPGALTFSADRDCFALTYAIPGK